MTEVWFDQPVELIRTDRVAQFWPTNSQSVEDRVNAASRFVVYATCLLYLIRRDVRLFVLGATALGVLYFMYRNDLVKNGMGRSTRGGNDSATCTMPTRENPMGNAMLHHYVDHPNKPPACWSPSVDSYRRHYLDNTFKYDSGRSRRPLPEYQRNHAARQFVSAPVSSLPGGEQTEFAEWLYGPKHGPLCRNNPRSCDPNARGVQLEAFGGLDPSGDPRTGMHGGSVSSA